MVLRANGLSRRVGDRTLFTDVDFGLAEGESLVVRGPSGSGKTVLLRQLAALDPLPSGEVTLHGRTPRAWGVPAYRARVAFVPQTPPVLPDTPAAWVARLTHLAAGQVHPTQAREHAAELGLRPDVWADPWVRLSGGEQQRLHLAIALAGSPDVLLLDEPTSALDPDSTAAVEAVLQGRSCVWVTHQVAQADRVADRRLVLGPP